jgi:D-xylose reductase
VQHGKLWRNLRRQVGQYHKSHPLAPHPVGSVDSHRMNLVHTPTTGKTRFIGLSNFNCQHIRQVLSIAKIRPTSLQIECHPHLSQKKLIRLAREAGVRVTAYSPLGGTSYISLDMATPSDLLFDNPIIDGISKRHNKTAAQVMLRWSVQSNTLPISKSSNLGRMRENRAVFDFYLTLEEVNAIDSLNKNHRYNDPGVFCEAGMGTFCPIYE